MIAALAVAPPATTAENGLFVAVTIALAVTALVAVGMAVATLHRTTRLTGFTVGISLATTLAILVGALLAGGSLTQPPAAALEDRGAKAVSHPPVGEKLTGIQLPTLGYEDRG